jgi:lysophospholipase L1-like esterase
MTTLRTILYGLLLMTQAALADSATPARLTIIGASYAGQWGTPALPGYAVTNKGIGGEDSSQVRARFARDVVAAKPDAVLIWGHINDIHRAAPGKHEEVKQRAKDNYRAMHAEAQAAGIKVILATEITFSLGDGILDGLMDWIASVRGKTNYRAMINGHVKDVNAWLRDYARQNQLQLLDLEKAVDSGNGSRRAEYDHDDKSHVNAAGYAAISAYAAKNLR